MQAWRSAFQERHPQVTVNYDPIGSGGGREQFLAGGIALAGSDDYLTTEELQRAEQRCNGPVVEVPVYLSPIAVVYHVPGVDELRLTPPTLAKIFAGDITRWDAPAITATNPGADLPDLRITPVHRSDESGTTGNFTDYLAQAAPDAWTFGAVETWPVQGGEGASGTSGVVAAVGNGAGTIGYADASQATTLDQALIGTESHFTGPTAAAAAAVLDTSDSVTNRPATDLAVTVDRTPRKPGIYPIVLVSYHIACSTYDDPNTARLVRDFESLVVSADGQQAAARQAGSAPLTPAMRDQARQAIETISAAD